MSPEEMDTAVIAPAKRLYTQLSGKFPETEGQMKDALYEILRRQNSTVPEEAALKMAGERFSAAYKHPDYQKKIRPFILGRMLGMLGIGGAAAVPAWMMSQDSNQQG